MRVRVAFLDGKESWLEIKDLELGENSVTLDTLDTLGAVLQMNGQNEEAKEPHEKCLAGRMELYGEQNKQTLGSLNNLGILYKNLKNYEKALEYYERARKGSEKLMGKNHPMMLAMLCNMGLVYKGKRNFQEAANVFQKVVDGHVAQLGKEHQNTKEDVKELVECLQALGDIERLAELKKAHPNLESSDTRFCYKE
ncbi:hypothetical protein TrLO_g14141 [Triparma laevis f. longispina]|uniref:Kinesin light chain n=1 Tax=Triparma laevis f. longispina TaxID=1714387 RepID=A0A9W7CCY6_9STRA|nr:hypothetical protein TrLO_g14141 [Triparma laevis f. longispina]